MAQRTCSIDGCEKVVKARGWCSFHHFRWWRYGSPLREPKTVEQRFAEKVLRTDSGCWVWTGAKNNHGYGQIYDHCRLVYVHRWAYEHHIASVPEGLCVLHRCDNPPCCNPAHLFLGTHADNMADMAAKGRARGGKPKEAGACCQR